MVTIAALRLRAALRRFRRLWLVPTLAAAVSAAASAAAAGGNAGAAMQRSGDLCPGRA